jgi:hypothetical protein
VVDESVGNSESGHSSSGEVRNASMLVLISLSNRGRGQRLQYVLSQHIPPSILRGVFLASAVDDIIQRLLSNGTSTFTKRAEEQLSLTVWSSLSPRSAIDKPITPPF